MRKKNQKELDKINALRLRLRLNGILSYRYAPHGIRAAPALQRNTASPRQSHLVLAYCSL
jgi:hypothetical protein